MAAAVAAAHDAMEDLGRKLKALASVNSETLELVATRREEEVVAGYSYSLMCALPRDAWTFTATPAKESVAQRLDAWEYSGEALDEPEDLFNDHVEYSLKTYADVVRLNEQLPAVGRKFLRLADNPGNREDLRVFVTNMERLQVAIGELHELTMDMKDSLSDDLTIREGMDELLAVFRKISTKLPASTMQFSSAHGIGRLTKDDSINEEDGGPCVIEISRASPVIGTRKLAELKMRLGDRVAADADDRQSLARYGISFRTVPPEACTAAEREKVQVLRHRTRVTFVTAFSGTSVCFDKGQSGFADGSKGPVVSVRSQGRTAVVPIQCLQFN